MKATLLVVKLPISASWECLLVATRLVSRTSQAHLVETSEKSKSLPATICQVKTSTDSTRTGTALANIFHLEINF